MSKLPMIAALLCAPVALSQHQGALNISRGINYAASSVGTDSYAITLGAPPSYTLAAGLCVTFKADVANTGAATLNLNSLGAVAIKKAAGGVTTDLADNDIRADQIVAVCHDGTNWQIQSTLGNAASGTGDVTAASSFGTDNVLIRSDGTGKGVQATGVTVNDGDAMAVPGGVLVGDGTAAGQLTLLEQIGNGTNFRRIKAPDALTADLTLLFPNAVPTAGQVLSWGAPSSDVSTGAFVSPALIDAANSWADGVKQVFNPNGTNVGFNPGAHASDPSSPVNGDVYYNSSTGKFRCYENSAWANCIGSGGGITQSSQGDGTDTISSAGHFATRYTIAGGTLSANKTIRIVAYGTITTDGTAPTPRYDIKFCTVNGCGSGSVITIASPSSAAVAANRTNDAWRHATDCRIRTSGASGVITCSGVMTYMSSSTNSAMQFTRITTGTTGTTIDTTVDQIIHAEEPNALSGDSLTLQQLDIQII